MSRRRDILRNKLLEKLRHQGKFHTRFRMSETAFNDLVELLRPAFWRCNKWMCSCHRWFLSKNSDAKKEGLRQQSNGLFFRTLRALWRELSWDL
mmetsp:Transcript_6005/g.8026  ORF Transcript_6005/g.8026 Transcript_6005/m.8026 type:complete len:94 (-) Transcript_6005:360-641(-)